MHRLMNSMMTAIMITCLTPDQSRDAELDGDPPSVSSSALPTPAMAGRHGNAERNVGQLLSPPISASPARSNKREVSREPPRRSPSRERPPQTATKEVVQEPEPLDNAALTAKVTVHEARIHSKTFEMTQTINDAAKKKDDAVVAIQHHTMNVDNSVCETGVGRLQTCNDL